MKKTPRKGRESIVDDILLIGIAGGSGSGKTTLTNSLVGSFPGNVSVVYYDSYYKDHSELPLEERAKLNYDAPEAFDTDYMLEQLRELKAGRAIESPVYDYTIHARSKETQRIEPNPVIIVEGILIFADDRLCDLFDIKIFVDTDADVRILRRLKRDMLERGRSLESIERQYLETVKPMHELYVEPTRRKAHIIVPEGGANFVAMEMIVERIASHVKQDSWLSRSAE